MDVHSIDATLPASSAAASSVGTLQAFPASADSPKTAAAPPHADDGTLHEALSQLVGGGSKVSVQYKVIEPNEIVTVFTNAETGQVITQFPSEAMVQIAQFFNKLAGAVVDRTA